MVCVVYTSCNSERHRSCSSVANVRHTHEYNIRVRSTLPSPWAAILQTLPSFVICDKCPVGDADTVCGVWAVQYIYIYIFQSSNYTLASAPCTPQDTSPFPSDKMGISPFLCAACCFKCSGKLQYEIPHRSLCLSFACVLFKQGYGYAGGLWWIMGAPERQPPLLIKDLVLQNQEIQKLFTCDPEMCRVRLWGGRIKRDHNGVTIGE